MQAEQPDPQPPEKGEEQMKYVIFAGSLHGKTTFARKHEFVVDPEAEPPEAYSTEEWVGLYWDYKAMESKWKEERILADKEKRNEAYNALAKYVITQSTAPIIVAHFNAANAALAKRAGRKQLFVRIDWNELSDRVRKLYDEEPDKAESYIFRLVASYGYAMAVGDVLPLDRGQEFTNFESALSKIRHTLDL
jgi:hypothetical protein